MTHELSPAQEAAHGLPSDVLARAAEAIDACEDTGYDPEQLVHIFITPALPILRPAIEAALVERMIAETAFAGFDERIILDEDEQGDPVTFGQWLREYRDLITEGATDHD